jgi:hypothetical protein
MMNATTATGLLGIVVRPGKGEEVSSRPYRIRLSAAEGVSRADVSLNAGPWEICRRVSANEWEYEWAAYGGGFHQVVARFRTESGAVYETPPRRFEAKS